jgi:hypothetical protein
MSNYTLTMNPSEDRIMDVLATLDLIGEDGEPTDRALYDAFYTVLEAEDVTVELYCQAEEKPEGEWGYSLGYPGCPAEATVESAVWMGQDIKLDAYEIEAACEKALATDNDGFGDY